MDEQNNHQGQERTKRGTRRHLQGRVVSDSSNPGRAKKTVIVEVERRYRHATYGKFVRSLKRYRAHDEKDEYRTNDIVEIRESRPLSATKRWVVVRLVKRPEEV
ncbi:MAG: 30S ribosomal protein S17 [Deltaproteobacteria bacterium]|nr:30S ribosomal protein S17 [Deltaproteobacteria bacterium]